MTLRGLAVGPELALVQAMHRDACALKELLRVVRVPGRAHVQHRETLGNHAEHAAVSLGQSSQRGVVEVVDQAGLGVHVVVRRLVIPREVARIEGPRTRLEAMLCTQRHADRRVRHALREADILAIGAGDRLADDGGLLEHRLQCALPLLHGLLAPHLHTVPRDALAHQEVRHLADPRGHGLVLRQDSRAARRVGDPTFGVLAREPGVLSSSAEHCHIRDILRPLEVALRQCLDHFVLPPGLGRSFDKHEGVEGVHHAAARVQLHAGFEAHDAQGVALGMGVLLGVAILAQQVVIQILAFLRNVRIQKHRMVTDGDVLVESEVLQCRIEVQLAHKGEGATDIGEDVDDDLRGIRGEVQPLSRQREQLREFLELHGVRKLHTRLGCGHELAEGGEALLHRDVQVRLVHHRIPAGAHRRMLRARRCGASGFPGHVPEVAEVEAGDTRRAGAHDGMARGVDIAARIDLSEGAHLQNDGVVAGPQLRDVAVGVHDEQSGPLRLRDEFGGLLVSVHLLVQHRDKVRVDMPWKPILPSVFLRCSFSLHLHWLVDGWIEEHGLT
mmetsp:Transcript_3650/g.13421  ORF Transcript_3650/g.13421 Transcript_3650/m.13421 type:complete len:557 (-) Transcript_3650:175-1845(-)